MDGQNSELVKQQVQAELANAYAQEFFTVRMPDLVLDLFPTLPIVPPPPPTWTPRLTRRSRSHPQTVREKCFAKCITKPGPSLSSGEATCVSRCTDRYVDATRMISGVVLQAYSSGQGGVQ
jgi:import inner membrane translocase subunit TIM13